MLKVKYEVSRDQPFGLFIHCIALLWEPIQATSPNPGHEIMQCCIVLYVPIGWPLLFPFRVYGNNVSQASYGICELRRFSVSSEAQFSFMHWFEICRVFTHQTASLIVTAARDVRNNGTRPFPIHTVFYKAFKSAWIRQAKTVLPFGVIKLVALGGGPSKSRLPTGTQPEVWRLYCY